MKRIFAIIFIAGLMMASMVATAQIPLESRDSQTVMNTQSLLIRADSADSTVIRLNGASASDSSGIYWAWKTVGISFTVSGTTPKLTILFKAGHGSQSASMTTISNSTMRFGAAYDSLTITSAGIYNYQLSLNMPADQFFYMVFRADFGNGTNTTISEGLITKDRY